MYFPTAVKFMLRQNVGFGFDDYISVYLPSITNFFFGDTKHILNIVFLFPEVILFQRKIFLWVFNIIVFLLYC